MLVVHNLKRILVITSLLLLLLFATGLQGLAQLSVYTDPFALYRDAEELFVQEKYGASQRKFGEFLQAVGANQNPSRAAVVAAVPIGNDKIAHARYFQALCAFRLRQQDAEPQLLQFLAIYPDYAQANVLRYSLGKLYFDAGNYLPATQFLRDAIAREGLSPDMTEAAEFMLGYSFLQTDDLPSAAAYLEKSAQKQTAWREKAQYYHSVLLYRQGDYSGAYEAFQDVRKSKTYSKEIQVYLANCLLQLQRYDELKTQAEEMEREGIQDPQVYYIVANAAYEEDDFEKASENYLLYTKSRGFMTRNDQFRYGYALYQAEEYKKSFDVLMNVMSTANDSLSQASNYYMGFCAYNQKSYEVARSAFNKASQMDANPIIRQDAMLFYAKTCLLSEFYEDALKTLKQYEKDYPKSPQMAEVKGLIGELMLYSSNYPEAITYLESVPRTSARTKEAYQTVTYSYGLALMKSEKYDEAEQMFRKTMSSDVDRNKTLSAYFLAAECRFRRKDYSAALDSYMTYVAQTGVKKHENYLMGIYGAAWSHFMLKNYSSAGKSFEEFIGVGSKSADAVYLSDANIRAGDCWFLRRDYPKAANFYLAATKLSVGQRDYAQYQLGECAYRQQQYTTSVQGFDLLARSFLGSEFRDDALNRLATITLDWLQDTTKSQIYDHKLIDEYRDSPYGADARIRLGYVTASTDRQKAVDYLSAVLVLYPGDDKNCQLALDGLRQLLADDPGRFNVLERDYLSKVPGGDKKLAHAQFVWGKDKFLQGDFNGSVGELTYYLEKFPNGEDVREALLYRARAQDRLNNSTAARADYNAVIASGQNDAITVAALREAAEMSYREGGYLAAISLYQQMEKATDKPAQKAQAQFGQADCHLATGSYAAAEILFRSLSQNETLSNVLQVKAKIKLGQALLRQGATDNAMAIFREVENQEQGSEQGAEAQQWVVAAEVARFMQVNSPTNITEVENTVRKIVNDYATFNYWKARSFLWLADAYAYQGSFMQARATYESLLTDERFPDIKQEATERLRKLDQK